MNEMKRLKIINELKTRIRDADNIDEYDVSFALENFLQWFCDSYGDKNRVEAGENE